MLLTMNILAFGLHTLVELTESKNQLVRETPGRRGTFLELPGAMGSLLPNYGD